MTKPKSGVPLVVRILENKRGVVEVGAELGGLAPKKQLPEIKPRTGLYSATSPTENVMEVTKKPDQTSAICPVCDGKRRRSYGRSCPMTYREMVENKMILAVARVEYSVNSPRISAKRAWWNKWIIRWLICPEEDFPYFLCWEVATCSQCGKTVNVQENSYYRQFGRIRMVIFTLKEGPDRSGMTILEALQLRNNLFKKVVQKIICW